MIEPIVVVIWEPLILFIQAPVRKAARKIVFDKDHFVRTPTDTLNQISRQEDKVM